MVPSRAKCNGRHALIGITVGPAVRPEAVTPELLRERVLALCARA
jgi:hypothetical protein